MEEVTLSALQHYGLDDKEIAVYLACLELGPAKVQQIADKAKIKRTTVYLVAESLKLKGLLSEFKEKSSVQFVATEPDHLLHLLNDKERRLHEAMPELLALANKGATKPTVRFYEGKQGILDICEDSLMVPNSEILFMSSLTDIYKLISAQYDANHYIPTRIKKNIRYRALVIKNPRTLVLSKNDKAELRETRFLPGGVKFASTQMIYQNKFSYISPHPEPMGVIIESAELACMERQKFELLWSACSPTK
ncbi:MAG TPA: helix-turn-helix domain-containing protein [Patescibacteria group bacterium]|nr:helix-turn-helix domain-containing protein [Patescibacteria group bacterium]